MGKAVARVLVGAIIAASAWIVNRDAPGPRPPVPVEATAVHAAIPGYRVEYSNRIGGWLRAPQGQLIPIDLPGTEAGTRYDGMGCKLWIVRPKGIAHRFLLLDAPIGAYSFRRILFLIAESGELARAADFTTVAEIQGDLIRQVMDSTFEDVDDDGVDEVVASNREWLRDEIEGRIRNDWAIRSTYLAWNGSSFQPAATAFSGTPHPPVMVSLWYPGKAGTPSLTKDQALAAVLELPELVEFREAVRQAPLCRGLAVYAEHSPEEGTGCWLFYVGQDGEDFNLLWNRLRVDAWTGEIRVWEPIEDGYLSLREWRRRR